ncbi:hypothetical protein DM01DRAFT_1081781 [Hesseltinella vesiculosa]|uniref:Uncharacterized protein n=1 Tax=Hesseltinella vesiculosa TaxID=101127 RepID=A0A1X2GE25_9FUNG|nr:hypothetical protein DM01DRAFT_1081781 [Hesseltinella vesiculosa]
MQIVEVVCALENPSCERVGPPETCRDKASLFTYQPESCTDQGQIVLASISELNTSKFNIIIDSDANAASNRVTTTSYINNGRKLSTHDHSSHDTRRAQNASSLTRLSHSLQVQDSPHLFSTIVNDQPFQLG